MAPIQLLLTLPADADLANLVEQRLAQHTEVIRLPPQAFDLATITLLVSLGASLAATGASLASMQQSRVATLKSILEIKQLLAHQGQAAQARIGTPAVGTRALADADEAFLRRLLELDA